MISLIWLGSIYCCLHSEGLSDCSSLEDMFLVMNRDSRRFDRRSHEEGTELNAV